MPHALHVDLSRDGILLASISGRVGGQLPQTSAAAENVAGLAAAAQTGVTTVNSDYKNLSGVESLPDHIALHPKGMYSGVRRRIRGICSRAYMVTHCRGHVDPSSCTNSDDAYRAIGNGHADRVAGIAAAKTPLPSTREFEVWTSESDMLVRWLRYVPRALALWPAARPTAGHKSLPKRAGPRAATGCSFASDVLGPWSAESGARASQSQRDVAPTAPQYSGSSSSIGPPPPSPAAETANSSQNRGDPPPCDATYGESQYHEWHWQGGRWLCVRCLASARTGVPRRQKCPGASPSIRGLLEDPKGHRLQIATFANGFGIVVICCDCGHLLTRTAAAPCTSNAVSPKADSQPLRRHRPESHIKGYARANTQRTPNTARRRCWTPAFPRRPFSP